MKTVAYSVIKDLAAALADRPVGKLPVGEAALMRMALAEELVRMWELEAWPDLTDNLEELTLDANKCFSTREGEATEMGRIVCVLEGGDPRVTYSVQGVQSWTRLANRVNVVAEASTVWVDWSLPAPDLMDGDLIADVDALDDYEVPVIFREALAYAGAAVLMKADNAAGAAEMRNRAHAALVTQAGKIRAPWWRVGRRQ